MDTKQKRIVLISFIAVLALWLISPILGSHRSFNPTVDNSRLQFDAALAHQNMREFVSQFPRRVIGSAESRQSSGFLQKRFKDLGYAVTYAHFNAIVASHKQVGRNIYAFKAGRTPEIIAVMAHYDIAGTTGEGAMDNGSGVGVLLELARIMAANQTQRGILFVASDGEEWGMLGSRDFAETYPQRDKIAAVLSLDYVAVGDLASLTLGTAGQNRGYTPPWLRTLARTSAELEGLPIYEASGFAEHLQRAVPVSGTDQGPLVEAGIAAVNLGSGSRNAGQELEVYHSLGDVAGNLKPESFKPFGRAAERILLELDGMAAVPRESMGPLRAIGNVYLPSSLMIALQCLAFVPLVLIAWFHLANHGRNISTSRVQRELSSFLATATPFFLGWSALFVMVRLRRLPRYSLYPATPKDPVLSSPAWGPMAWIFGTALVSAIALYLLLRFLRDDGERQDFFVSKTINLLLFLALAVFALVYSPYWAATFLLLPAWIWGLIGPGKGYGDRAANRILMLAAGILYVVVACVQASQLCVGWNWIWYQVLALSTGMINWQAFVLTSAALALAIRFLAIQSHGSSDSDPRS
jgi:hypothetical protein